MNRKLLLLVLTIASVAYGQPAGPVLAPIPNGTILGNSSGSTAAPSAQSNPTVSGIDTTGNLNVTPTGSTPVPGEDALSWYGPLTGSSSTAADYAPANIYVASDTFSNTSSAGRVD